MWRSLTSGSITKRQRARRRLHRSAAWRDHLHLLSSNGAEKSTLIRAILCLTPARKGRILWNEADIAAEETHNIIARGISCIPEGRKVFPRLTVAEHLALGAFLEADPAIVRERIARVYEIFPRLRERSAQLTGTRCRAVSRPSCRSVAG